MPVSDAEFIAAWNKHGTAKLVAQELGTTERNVYRRKIAIAERHSLSLTSIYSPKVIRREHSQRADFSIENGVIMVASDAHYWPGVTSVAHTAFVKTIKNSFSCFF